MQLLDVESGVWMLARTSHTVGRNFGMDIHFQGYTVEEPSLAHLRISGIITRKISVVLINNADEGGTIELDYNYTGLRHCPEMPPGCARFEEATAQKELR